MRLTMVAIFFLVSGSLTFAQKTPSTGLHRVSSSKARSAPKSVSSDAVAATLRTNSNTLNELSKIEHQNITPKSAVTTPRPFTSQAANPSLGKNKPMHFSYKAPQGNAVKSGAAH